MLKKPYRLRSRGEFKRALAGRRLCANDCFVLFALPQHPSGSHAPPRFGFIVSKKVDKRATARNRIKRRLRELVRREWLEGPLPESLRGYRALVFIARTGALDAPFAALKAKLARCLPPPP